jgi:lipid A 3-O-deacylase
LKNIIILSAVTILFAILAVPPTRAESTYDPSEPDLNYEIRFGVLAHDVDGLWSGSKKEDGVDYNFEIILRRHCLSFLKGSVCPNSGVNINSQGDTSRLYLGLLWEHEIKSGIFIDIGLGATLHNGELETSDPEKKELGSRVLFRIPIEIGYALNKHHRLLITFENISNAYLANPNEGMDSLGLRYGYRF